jgi:hypothetical protein
VEEAICKGGVRVLRATGEGRDGAKRELPFDGDLCSKGIVEFQGELKS